MGHFYAVAKGRKAGIYTTWGECKEQVNKFPGPKYRKFSSRAEAEAFVRENGNPSLALKKPNAKAQFEAAFGQSSASKRSSSVKLPSEFKIQTRRKTQLIDFDSLKELCTKENNFGKLTKDGFMTDDDGFVNVFTDGACTQNGKKKAKAGVGVWFADNHPLNVSRPVIGRQTNNMAEILAVTIAAKQAHKAGVTKLKINTDSKFLISCITQWMQKWKSTGWRTADGKPVINKVELIEMETALAPLQVSWNHVRGHAGIYGNEMADKLARNGINNGDDD